MRRALFALALLACDVPSETPLTLHPSFDTNEPQPISDVASDKSDTTDTTQESSILIFEGPRRLLPGRPSLVGVRSGRDSGAFTTPAGEVLLHRGRGVMAITPDARATTAGPDARAVVPFDATDPSDIRITTDLVVPAGETLVWPAGARIMIAPDVQVRIDGRLEARGTPDAPILVTSATSGPWSTLEIRGEADLSEVWLTSGGGGTPRYGGHSSSNPVLAVVGGRLAMTGGAIAHNPGKALWSDGGTVSLSGVLIARCDTGGEYVSSTVELADTHVLEIPDADGRFDDDDNDGLYLRLSTVEIRDSVVSLTEDDGIDHNGSELVIRGSIIEDVRHEGLACSDSGTVRLEDSLVRGATHAVEAGYGAPRVEVVHSILRDAAVGVRWGDEYEWESAGTLTVSHTVFANVGQATLTIDPQQGEAPAGAITMTCTVTDPDVVFDPEGCAPESLKIETCEGVIGRTCGGPR